MVKRFFFNPILHGLFGGRECMGGAKSAHPHQNVSKPYLRHEIDIEQSVGVYLHAPNSLGGQNYDFGSNIGN